MSPDPSPIIDSHVVVPIGWLIALVGAMLAAFWGWLRTEWTRNWKEHERMRADAAAAHERMRADAAAAHKELDNRIDTHHDKIDKHIIRIHNRIDWQMAHTPGVPAYPGDDDEEG